MFIQLQWTVYIARRCICWMSRTLVTTGQGVLDTGGKAKSQPCLTDGGKAKRQPSLTDGGKAKSQPWLTDGGKAIADLDWLTVAR